MKRRPIYVRQAENGRGQFWWVVKAPNGRITAQSEMFPSRANAKRAARAFIATLNPLIPLQFSYWVGKQRTRGYRLITERIR